MSSLARRSLAALCLFLSATASAQVQRTFVASFGSDANVASNCTLMSPCRSFSAAQNATISGGEIVALDAAGYGAVTITKSISILANPGVYAGISAPTDVAIRVLNPGLNVRLSGLKINGTGGAGGIEVTVASTITIENCTVTGFLGNGLHANNGATVRVTGSVFSGNSGCGICIGEGATADIVDTRAFGNGWAGFVAENYTGGVTSVAVTNSVSSRNLEGVLAQAGGLDNSVVKVTVSNSTADNNTQSGFVANGGGGTGISATLQVSASKSTGNNVGLTQNGTGAILKSSGNNFVTGNTSAATFGTITNVGTQ